MINMVGSPTIADETLFVVLQNPVQNLLVSSIVKTPSSRNGAGMTVAG